MATHPRTQAPTRVGAATAHGAADWGPLVRLVLVLAATGGLLGLVAGPPRLPDTWPEPLVVAATLRGSSLPLEPLGVALVDLAWLVWAWLGLSLGLRLLLALAELATHGARWVRSLRGLSDWITIPLVRRAVDSALAVALMAQVVAHAAPAAAAPLPTAITAQVEAGDAQAVVQPTAPAGTVTVEQYTVRGGDNLWSIAERFYGTGHEFPRLVEANLNRPMRDGAVFGADGVIEPGWVLRVPLASTQLDVEDGQAWYTVERGDTLWGISARFLGDPTRWPSLFDANQGASLDDGRTLSDPDLIWPGLRLQVPVELEAPPERMPVEPSVPVVTTAPSTDAGDASEVIAQPAIDGAQATYESLMAPGAAAGTAAVGAAAIGLLLLKRRGRRGLDEPPLGEEPESDVLVRGGFAEVEDLVRGGAGDPVQPLAADVLRFLDERGFQGRVGLVAVRHGRSSTTLALVCQRLADRPQVVELAPALASRLGLEVRAQLSRDHDILLRLVGVRRARFAAPQRAPQSGPTPCNVVPLGLLPDRRLLYVNWPAAGHALVAGRSAMAVSTVLSTLVGTLAARTAPAELQVVCIARPDALRASLGQLPHLVGRVIDPDDHVATTAALHEARAELLRRMERVERGAGLGGLPEVVLVVPALETLGEHASTLEMLGVYGAAHRVRLIAGTTHPAALPDSLLAHFALRAVLRLADAAQSGRLLGQPDAVDLVGGGQLLLRLDSREPVEVYACRAADAELDRLVRTTRGDPLDPLPPRPPAAWSLVDEPLDADDDDADDGVVALPLVAEPVLDLSAGRRVAVPRVQVRCFGGFDVLDGAEDLTQASSAAEAAERAVAWEVLAYLSCQPEGLAGRDELGAAIWPGLAVRQATPLLEAALGQLGGLLRANLSAPLVWLDARDGVVRLDVERIASDVHAFDRLVRAAPLMPVAQAIEALRRARELYAGDLLDGPGARAYAWVTTAAEDGELSLREAYREQYLRATLRLARLLARDGQPAEAIPLFQSLLEVEPLLEDVVRELYACHAALGDRAALLDQERQLRSALRQAHAGYARAYAGPEDDGPEPEPATAALFSHLLEDLDLRAAQPA